MKSLTAGIDLHSNNLYCGIIDSEGRKLFLEKLPTNLPRILKALKPFKKRLGCIAVESTYNWYWLVDGLMEAGYDVALANPAQIQQYSGIKQTDDNSDALFLAELLRLKILPTAYICNGKWRALRDLLRRRMGLVQQRTALYLSLKSLHTRTTGQSLSLNEIKKAGPSQAQEIFTGSENQLVGAIQLRVIESLDQGINEMERTVLARIKGKEPFKMLQSVPGIGPILGMTILMETIDIDRFATAGDFASYCRCVGSKRLSNGKTKGRNNSKCGNKYLAWAFVEAAHTMVRFCDKAKVFYERKVRQRNSSVATKALACKLAKACWHLMKEGTTFEEKRIFG